MLFFNKKAVAAFVLFNYSIYDVIRNIIIVAFNWRVLKMSSRMMIMIVITYQFIFVNG